MQTSVVTDDVRPQLQVVEGQHRVPLTSEQWESVYRETVVLVYRFIFARVGNRPDAEDMTTKVFMRALPRLRLPAAPEEIRSYLVATARTVLADHWRNHYDVQLAVLEADLPSPPRSEIKPEEEDAGVHRAGQILAGLPDNYRQVLELRFLRGYSIRETASALGVSVANAKVLQFRALRRAAAHDQEAGS
jgi:RNA polymerase sigma-70 factor (ECF subfamily)